MKYQPNFVREGSLEGYRFQLIVSQSALQFELPHTCSVFAIWEKGLRAARTGEVFGTDDVCYVFYSH